ncbi:MAG: hypothetical protein AB8B69_04690 [Chitinophagales bacterium]
MTTNQKVNGQAMPTTQGTTAFNDFQYAEIERPDLVKGGVVGEGDDAIVDVIWI